MLGCAEILRGVDPAIGIGGSGGGGDRYPAVANGATVLQDAVAAVAEKAAVPRAVVVRAVEIFGLPAGEHIDTRKNSTADEKQLHCPEIRFILTCYTGTAYAKGATFYLE